MAQFAESYPDKAPEGVTRFVREWAWIAVERSDNLWDFRRYSDDRWTIPAFTGGGADDPNEVGNVAGFSAPALAAARLLGNDPLAGRLREIATAQVDNFFGRNPAGRHASYDAPSETAGFEGVERGWYSEYYGGAGLLEGESGVLDGSPKNGLYPFSPEKGNIGHTEGWVAFNTAWNESLAWRAVDQTRLRVTSHDHAPARVVKADETVRVELAAPLNLDAEALGEGTVEVRVGDHPAKQVTVTQTAKNSKTFTATLDVSTLHAKPREAITVTYGHAPFAVSYSFTVAGRD